MAIDHSRIIGDILQQIKTHSHFLVSGHVRSDGDALGSQLALHRMLQKMGKDSHVVCDRGASPEYQFLPGADQVGDGPESLRDQYDAMLVADTGSLTRLERLQDGVAALKPYIINIDHHSSNERFGSLNWVDPSYSASGEMVYELIQASGVPLDTEMATCLYVAIVTDTGRFSFSNTTVRTHRIAADLVGHGVQPGDIHNVLFRNKTMPQLKLLSLVIDRTQFSPDRRVAWIALTRDILERAGYVPNETQDYIDLLKSIRGVDVAILLREGDEPGTTKASFRTEKSIDATKIAARFKGGGHPRAAGCTVRAGIAQATQDVVRETMQFISSPA